MTELLTHSQSSLLMYIRCGEQYRRRFIENDIRPPGVRMLRGTGIHAGAQFNFRQKRESHEDLASKKIIDYSIAIYDARYNNEGVTLAPEEKTIGRNKVVGQERDRVWRLAELQALRFAPTIQPVSVEQTIEAEFPSLGFKVRGTLDLKDETEIITDIKSSVKSRTKGDVHKDFQLTNYFALDYILNKKFAKGCRLAVLVDKKKPDIQILDSVRAEDDLDTWVRTIKEIDKAIRAGVFPPANKVDWWCSPRWCGYWFDCQYWSDSERSRVAS